MKTKRQARFEMRLSADEAEVLQDMANREGVSKGDMLRMLLLAAARKDRKYAVVGHGDVHGEKGKNFCNVAGCLNTAERRLTSQIERLNIGWICDPHWDGLTDLIVRDQYYPLKEST